MKIFHGGTEIVKSPRIISSYTGRDFGIGFYTTDIMEQAIKWAKRQALYRRKDSAILNIYEFDNDVSDLSTKVFNDYSIEWLDFVINCRGNLNYKHTYDLVTGKIANDNVGETIQAVIDGLTSKDFALTKIVFMEANNQICFSTQKALNHIKFVSSRKVN